MNRETRLAIKDVTIGNVILHIDGELVGISSKVAIKRVDKVYYISVKTYSVNNTTLGCLFTKGNQISHEIKITHNHANTGAKYSCIFTNCYFDDTVESNIEFSNTNALVEMTISFTCNADWIEYKQEKNNNDQ